jgi:hypothetical protein
MTVTRWLNSLDRIYEQRETLVRTIIAGVVIAVVVWAAAADSISLSFAIRVCWTILTFSGTIVASVNCREAVIDYRVLRTADIDGTLRLQAGGAVYDQSLKVIALGADFLAGLASFLPFMTPIPLVMLCISALMLINLSFAQERRRQRLLTMLRANYRKKNPSADQAEG